MLIGITGYAQSGKDSVAKVLVEEHGFQKMALADGVRTMLEAINPQIRVGLEHYATADGSVSYLDLLKAVGYERAKQFGDVRTYLQRIGTEAVRQVFGQQSWVNLLDKRIFDAWYAQALAAVGGDPDAVLGDHTQLDVVVPDVRFPNEAEYIHAQGGMVVRVKRPGYGGTDPHPSEQFIESIEVDATVEATNLDELHEQVHFLFPKLQAVAFERRQAQALAFPEPKPYAPRVYLAGPWVNRAECAVAKERLVAAGIEVVSGWTERENSTQEATPVVMREQAILDRDEVSCANTIVLLGLTKSEGKATELGMALAQGKRIIVVKENRAGNIFYHLPNVEMVETVDEAIGALIGPNPNGILGSIEHDAPMGTLLGND